MGKFSLQCTCACNQVRKQSTSEKNYVTPTLHQKDPPPYQWSQEHLQKYERTNKNKVTPNPVKNRNQAVCMVRHSDTFYFFYKFGLPDNLFIHKIFLLHHRHCIFFTMRYKRTMYHGWTHFHNVTAYVKKEE